VEIYKISAVTPGVENMARSCRFYSQIPGFKLVYGGSSYDTFTTFEIGEGHILKMCLNLELAISSNIKNLVIWQRMIGKDNTLAE
jgi:catechol 2,3-dioxygenase-like lactoylglutathione lyase family enzyme